MSLETDPYKNPEQPTFIDPTELETERIMQDPTLPEEKRQELIEQMQEEDLFGAPETDEDLV